MLDTCSYICFKGPLSVFFAVNYMLLKWRNPKNKYVNKCQKAEKDQAMGRRSVAIELREKNSEPIKAHLKVK